MPTRTEIVENLRWLTERISDRAWTISVGVLGMSLGFIIEAGAKEQPFLAPQLVAGPAVLAFLALATDLVQYLVADRQNRKLLAKMERYDVHEAEFDRTDPEWKVRELAFKAKIVLTLAAAGAIAGLSTWRAYDLL